MEFVAFTLRTWKAYIGSLVEPIVSCVRASLPNGQHDERPG